MTQEEAMSLIKFSAANRDFAGAAKLAIGFLESVSDDSAARQFVRSLLGSREFLLIGNNVSIAAGTDAFFRPFAKVVISRFGETAEESIAVAERLAFSHAYQQQYNEAAAVLELVFAAVKKQLGENHATTQRLRYNLECQYRNSGRTELAGALVPKTQVCEHLREIDQYIRSQGVKVTHVGSPWSQNCRKWVTYRDVLLDTAALVKRFNIVAPVEVHDHRGTHDGCEHGLVCTQHHDALIGAHPSMAAGFRVVS